MKAIIVSISLIASALVLAAPAAAQCQSVPETGTFACANVNDAQNFNVFASQQGVGGASADSYEFSFFGMTMRGKNVNAHTAYDSPAGYNGVGYSNFCFVDASGGCAFQDDFVWISTQQTGYSSVFLSQSGDYRIVCVSHGDTFECQEF